MFISGAFVCTCAFLLLCKRCCSRFNSFKLQLMLEISESVLIKTIILLYKKHTHIMPEFVSQSITVRTQHRIHRK